MSNVARVAGQAANTLTKPLNVEDVFSTYLYEGSAPSSQTITNGIDLAGEGGLVWIKNRDYNYSGMLHDTEATGVENVLRPTTTSGIGYDVDTLTSFNSDGFTIGGDSEVNESGTGWASHVSWTFRKAPKFFDIVTWSGDNTRDRQISHNLGSVPGFIIVKKTSNTGYWPVYHRGLTSNDYYLRLNGTDVENEDGTMFDAAPTSTHFIIGNQSNINASGEDYVAYLFAHNDGDGGFGPNGDADIIKCGSFTHSTSTGNDIDLGFEPQWLLFKSATSVSNWYVWDSMRRWNMDQQQYLTANLTNAESLGSNTAAGWPQSTSTGFKVGTNSYAGDNQTYIYVAIGRPTAVPENATDVFAITTETGGTLPTHDTGFVTDFSLRRENALSSTSIIHATDRVRGRKYLSTEGTNAEVSNGNNNWEFMDGWGTFTGTNSDKYAWSWKRAPNFFDVVAYTGNGTAGRTVSHNLGVAPEMMWIKSRNATLNWYSYHASLGNGYDVFLNLTNAQNPANTWNYTDPTSTDFTLSGGRANVSGNTYIAYLFASLDGVSKVGSYTGSASDQTIDCGFSSGARFVLIKNVSAAQGWTLFDTERGIVAGNDPVLFLNATDAEFTGADYIDPHSSGFTLVGGKTATNNATYDYIFYAIA